MIEVVLIALVLIVAGLAKGIVGLGLPPIAMGLLVIVMPPLQAAAVVVVPALLTNLWQAAVGGAFLRLLRRFWLMFVLTGAVTLATAPALEHAGDATIAVLGVLIAAYGGYSLARPQMCVSVRGERWVGPLSGVLTGGFSGLTGVYSMPSVPFLQAVGLRRDEFVQAMGISFSISAIALASALGMGGGLASVSSTTVVIATAAAFAGLGVGLRIRAYLPEARFRQVFLWCLVLLGSYLFVRSFI